MAIMLSCREATELMSREVDASLPLGERLSLGFHLSLCRGCRNFRGQMDFLHIACARLASGAAPSHDQEKNLSGECKD